MQRWIASVQSAGISWFDSTKAPKHSDLSNGCWLKTNGAVWELLLANGEGWAGLLVWTVCGLLHTGYTYLYWWWRALHVHVLSYVKKMTAWFQWPRPLQSISSVPYTTGVLQMYPLYVFQSLISFKKKTISSLLLVSLPLCVVVNQTKPNLGGMKISW